MAKGPFGGVKWDDLNIEAPDQKVYDCAVGPLLRAPAGRSGGSKPPLGYGGQVGVFGGRDRDRTCDLCLVRAMQGV